MSFEEVFYLKWDIGSHIAFRGTLSKAIEDGISFGAYAIQFFLGNPKSFTRSRMSDDDITEAKRLTDRFPMTVISHSPYMFNWAGTVKDLAWAGNEDLDNSMIWKLAELEYEVNVLANFPRNGVVVHPGCHTDRLAGCRAIGKSLSKINFHKNGRILLENSAGEGNKLGNTFVELKLMYDSIVQEKQKHFGFCVDTAHIFGNGEYDLRKCDEVKRMFREFDETIGLDKLSLIHLNDSRCDDSKGCDAYFGSKKDRHAMIGEGYIWGESFDSLLTLLDFIKKHKIPLVLETTPFDLITMGQIGDLYRP
jgi:deoxyribonuclease-4